MIFTVERHQQGVCGNNVDTYTTAPLQLVVYSASHTRHHLWLRLHRAVATIVGV